MHESAHTASLPMREGVSASVVSVPQGAAHVLDFLAERMPGISRKEWADRLAQGLVLHEDGQTALPHQSCQPGQRLYYYRHLADEPVLPFRAHILFEDAHLLVADKPHFMPVTPSGRYVQQSLLVQLKRLTGCADLVPLHRIDRETAGLVLLGKRLQDRDAYHALFRDKNIHKTYHALAAARFSLASGVRQPARAGRAIFQNEGSGRPRQQRDPDPCFRDARRASAVPTRTRDRQTPPAAGAHERLGFAD